MDGSDRRAYAPIFEARVDERNGVTLIALSGELDMATSVVLEETVANLNGKAHDSMLVDLRELSFIDSSGVRALAMVMSDLKDSATHINVVAASDPVKRVFELLGLEGILNGTAPLELLHRFAKRHRE